MPFLVTDNADIARSERRSGFRNAEFKMLAGLFSRASAAKLVYDMAVDADMEAGVCSFAYYRTKNAPASLTFVVRHAGPQANMYEVWQDGKGRIFKSGLFARAFERLESEIDALAT